MLKVLCQGPDERLASLREVVIAVVAFLVENVVVLVVSGDVVEVDVTLLLMGFVYLVCDLYV